MLEKDYRNSVLSKAQVYDWYKHAGGIPENRLRSSDLWLLELTKTLTNKEYYRARGLLLVPWFDFAGSVIIWNTSKLSVKNILNLVQGVGLHGSLDVYALLLAFCSRARLAANAGGLK